MAVIPSFTVHANTLWIGRLKRHLCVHVCMFARKCVCVQGSASDYKRETPVDRPARGRNL